MPTHYEMLGVHHSVSDTEVRKAFQAVAKLYHPDVLLRDPTEEELKILHTAQSAYEALKDPAERKRYDAELALLAKSCQYPGCGGTGRIQTRKGFRVTETVCPACSGKGKR